MLPCKKRRELTCLSSMSSPLIFAWRTSFLIVSSRSLKQAIGMGDKLRFLAFISSFAFFFSPRCAFFQRNEEESSANNVFSAESLTVACLLIGAGPTGASFLPISFPKFVFMRSMKRDFSFAGDPTFTTSTSKISTGKALLFVLGLGAQRSSWGLTFQRKG